jgi:hypothetical protein
MTLRPGSLVAVPSSSSSQSIRPAAQGTLPPGPTYKRTGRAARRTLAPDRNRQETTAGTGSVRKVWPLRQMAFQQAAPRGSPADHPVRALPRHLGRGLGRSPALSSDTQREVQSATRLRRPLAPDRRLCPQPGPHGSTMRRAPNVQFWFAWGWVPGVTSVVLAASGSGRGRRGRGSGGLRPVHRVVRRGRRRRGG